MFLSQLLRRNRRQITSLRNYVTASRASGRTPFRANWRGVSTVGPLSTTPSAFPCWPMACWAAVALIGGTGIAVAEPEEGPTEEKVRVYINKFKFFFIGSFSNFIHFLSLCHFQSGFSFIGHRAAPPCIFQVREAHPWSQLPWKDIWILFNPGFFSRWLSNDSLRHHAISCASVSTLWQWHHSCRVTTWRAQSTCTSTWVNFLFCVWCWPVWGGQFWWVVAVWGAAVHSWRWCRWYVIYINREFCLIEHLFSSESFLSFYHFHPFNHFLINPNHITYYKCSGICTDGWRRQWKSRQERIW